MHNELDPACPQECVGDYVKGKSIPYVSESRILHTHITAKKISGTESPILNRMTLVNPGKKNIFADIIRS